MDHQTSDKDAAVHRLAKSITQLTLCQVTTSEAEAATNLLSKASQKLQGIQNIPSQRLADLEAAIRQLRQIGCILDSCTISASYEVTQAQKAILLLDHTAKGASTSSEELNAQITPRTDDEHNLPYHEPNRNDGAMRDVLVGYLSPPPHSGRHSSELPQAQRLSS